MRIRVLGLLTVTLFAFGAASFAGCERKGPAERAGEKIDKAAENVRDAVDPPRGPLEKAGRKVDRAVDGD